MGKNASRTLTSVKVEKELFEEFKIQTIRYKFSLQKLVDRGIYLYLNDEEFRNKLHNTNNLEYQIWISNKGFVY